MFDEDGDVIMLRVKPFTIFTVGATGVDWKAEVLANSYNLEVKVLVPPCHPRSNTLKPLTHAKVNEAIPSIQVAQLSLNKQLTDPISRQYIQRNYCVVKQADLVLAFTLFQPNRTVLGLQVQTVCMGGTGWTVEFAKILRKPLYVFDVEADLWYWFDYKLDRFKQCDAMSERQICLPTFVPKTAIVGLRNIYDFHNAVTELERTFARSVQL